MNNAAVLSHVEGGVAVITLNRPERLNAWTPLLGEQLHAAISEAARDTKVKPIVLTGAGRGFCAGMDFDQLSNPEDNIARKRSVSFDASVPRASERSDYSGLFNYFPSIGKPIIAAINGPVAGSGAVLALSCDIRFMSDDAVFTTSFSQKGLVAEHGIAWLLSKLVGKAVCLDLLLSGRKVSARESLSLGLANFVSPPGETLSQAMCYAIDLAQTCSPYSMQIIKKQIWDVSFQSLEEATEIANQAMFKSFSMPDFQEALLSRKESRQPQFTDLQKGV